VREISKERFVAEMVSLRAAFEKTVQELTREAKSRALVAMASLKVPDCAMNRCPQQASGIVYALRASS
jgi:hypothetical protein